MARALRPRPPTPSLTGSRLVTVTVTARGRDPGRHGSRSVARHGSRPGAGRSTDVRIECCAGACLCGLSRLQRRLSLRPVPAGGRGQNFRGQISVVCAGRGAQQPCTSCGARVRLESRDSRLGLSRAETTAFRIARTPASAIAPDRRSAAAERVDSSSVLGRDPES